MRMPLAQETAWRQLPLIAQHLGKRGFKRYLEPFLDPLFMQEFFRLLSLFEGDILAALQTVLCESVWSCAAFRYQCLAEQSKERQVTCLGLHMCRSVQSATHQGCQAAAIAAAAFLRDWLGPRIFAGRLPPPQQELMLRFVPTMVRANKACYVAEYDKSGGVC